jgi:hypothetical protein
MTSVDFEVKTSRVKLGIECNLVGTIIHPKKCLISINIQFKWWTWEDIICSLLLGISSRTKIIRYVRKGADHVDCRYAGG